MLGQHHLIIGWTGVVAIGALALQNGQPLPQPFSLELLGYSVPDTPILLGAAAVGSLLPDIDHPKAMLNNFSPVFKLVFAAPSLLFRHRGFTHSLLAWGILTAVILWLAPPEAQAYLLAGSAGYILHMAADALTVSGVPLFWPLYRKPVGFPPSRRLRFPTGSTREYVVVALAVAATAALVFQTGWPLPA